MSNRNNFLWYYDINANIDNDKNIVIVNNDKAIMNALHNWLQTKEGEILNKPNDGGSLFKYNFKTLSGFKKLQLLVLFRSQLDNYFSPKIDIIELNIEQDYSLQETYIHLKYFIPNFDKIITDRISINKLNINLENISEIKEIEYIGNTLENFVKINLWDMTNKSLKWNGSKWQWGDKYIFVNLQDSDTNFEKINDLINSNRFENN